MNRNEVIASIKKDLRARSGKSWSVRGGSGTAYGWIKISSMPKRQNEFGYISDEDRAELKTLLALETIHSQGVNVPASTDYYTEYTDRAAGRTPSVFGVHYWD